MASNDTTTGHAAGDGAHDGPRSRNAWRVTKIVIATVLVAIAVGLAIIFSGVYSVAADAPHSGPVFWLLETARDRSVAVRARNIHVPTDLRDSTRVATGAGLYDDMCSNCHLAPGMKKTEISQGLYPPAPELAKDTDLTPAEEFWIIKHGLKETGMAAWGKTHADSLIWDMVALLRRLPALSPDQYKALVKSAPADHDDMMMEPETTPR